MITTSGKNLIIFIYPQEYVPKFGSTKDIDLKDGFQEHGDTFGINVEIQSSNEIKEITSSKHFVISS